MADHTTGWFVHSNNYCYPTIRRLTAEVGRLKEDLIEALTHITGNMIKGAEDLIERNEETLAEIARIKAQAILKGGEDQWQSEGSVDR